MAYWTMGRAVPLAVLSAVIGAHAVADDAFFHARIEPILVGKCLTCHGADKKGDLDLRSAAAALTGGETGPAYVAGDADASLLIDRVAAHEMPPKSPLSDEEIAALRQWIADGAFFPETPLDPFAATSDTRAGYDWWSFQPLSNLEPPNTGFYEGEWTALAIDRYIGAKLAEANLKPNPPADPATLIRRATYDLIGLPPTPDEIAAFEKACADEMGRPGIVGNQAYLALLDRLLASPGYGEQWGRHWLDVVRYGESTGFEVNAIVENAWPYRDYVIDSFNDDKPFDRFIQEQIAGDALAPGDPGVEIGLTFLVCGPYDMVGNQDPVQAAQIRANTVDEIIRASSEAFLGLTVGCARCHDHKFDPISQKEYYSFYATFAGVSHGDRVVATKEEIAARDAIVDPIVETRDEAAKAFSDLESAILARAESKAAEYEAGWTRPKIARALTEETFPAVDAQYVRLVSEGRDTDVNSTADHRIDEFEIWSADNPDLNVALASHGATADGPSRKAQDFAGAYQPDRAIDGRYGEAWIAAGPTLTITLPEPVSINRVTFSSDRPGAVGTLGEATFLSEYRIETSLDGEAWTVVATSHDRKPVNDAHRRKRFLDGETTDAERSQLATYRTARDEAQQKINAVPSLMAYSVGTYAQPEGDQKVFLGGDPQRQGDVVVPASMKGLSEGGIGYALASDAPEQQRRVAMANWITDPRNPLTARVLANRLWHYHFGTGIVSTPSDFGFMGMPPSHPGLLDWLARELMAPTHNPYFKDEGDMAWRLKRMHKLIMLSSTYRQASTYRPDAAAIDGDSRLLWRFPPRRLTGEEIRDTMLQTSGNLDRTMGGYGFRLYRYLRDNVATYVPLDEHGPETYRRAVYHQRVRAAWIDLMTDFDSPDCALATPRRDSTTSPLQALTLMNHGFTMDIARALANRVEQEGGNEVPGQVRRAFLLTFGREPNADETARATALIERHGLPAFCRALYNANEFIYLN